MNIIGKLSKKTTRIITIGLSLTGAFCLAGFLFQTEAKLEQNSSNSPSMTLAGEYAALATAPSNSIYLSDFMAFVNANINEYSGESYQDSKTHFIVSHPYDQTKASCLDISSAINL